MSNDTVALILLAPLLLSMLIFLCIVGADAIRTRRPPRLRPTANDTPEAARRRLDQRNRDLGPAPEHQVRYHDPAIDKIEREIRSEVVVHPQTSEQKCMREISYSVRIHDQPLDKAERMFMAMHGCASLSNAEIRAKMIAHNMQTCGYCQELLS